MRGPDRVASGRGRAVGGGWRRVEAAPVPRLPGLRLVLAVLALALVPIALAGTAAAQADRDAAWEGQWHSFWRGGQALIQLEQDVDRVSGTYRPGDGRIQARVENGILKGAWAEPGESGTFEFALSPDGTSFAGRYGNGEYWNGRRIEPGSFSPTPFNSDATVQDAFRTILIAGNIATAGDSTANLVFEPLLAYAGPATDTSDRQRRRVAIYRLLDMSTVRITDFPALPEEDRVSLELGPAGSDFTFTIDMVRDEDVGGWRLLVPPLDELLATEEALLSALGFPDYATYRYERSDSPRETMRDFLLGTRDWYAGGAERATGAMDLSGIPPALVGVNAPLYADYLRQVIDRLGYVVWQEIPDDPDRVVPYVFYRHAEGDITIGPTRTEDGVTWRFTPETIEAVPAIYEAIQSMPLAPGLTPVEPFSRYFTMREWVRDLSPGLLERGFLLAHWQWIAILIGVLIASLAAFAAGRLVAFTWRRLPARLTGEDEATVSRAGGIATAARLIAVGLILFYVFGRIGLRTDVLSVLATGAALTCLVGVVALIYQLVGAAGDMLHGRSGSAGPARSRYVDEIVTSLATGITKIAVIVAGLIVGADIVGLPYEGVIAGLGVGGLALAIAARDTVSNFFGAAVLLADRPFKQGDFVEVDGRYAIVEEVGLRSSRLRMFDDALMIIPNGKIADNTVINYGRRRKRQVKMVISLTYDTPRERLDGFVVALKEMLDQFPRADAEFYVGLSALSDWSIDVDMWCYLWVATYSEQVDYQHRLIGDIVALAERTGVSFAFPTRTVHVATDDRPPLEAARPPAAAAAE